jgi:superfamily II DNA helicase RecQ
MAQKEKPPVTAGGYVTNPISHKECRMTSKNVANVGHIVTEKTIDSQSLLAMVNQAREKCGERPVRNNVFIERIRDELEGEGYKSFVTPMDKAKGGADQVMIEMTVKQALRVAARESKAVRRSLVDKLEDMQAIQVPVQSNSGLPEYRLAKAEQLKAMALEKNIASARELIAMLPRLDPMAHQTLAASLINPLIGYDAIPLPVIEQHYYTAGEVAEKLGVTANKIGRVANANNLKTEQYGKFFLDKSKHSDKQVEAFRYNGNGIEALRHIISGAAVA